MTQKDILFYAMTYCFDQAREYFQDYKNSDYKDEFSWEMYEFMIKKWECLKSKWEMEADKENSPMSL